MALPRDRGKAEPPPKKKRTPPPATPSFTRSPFGEKPFAPQQKAAQQHTDRARRKLPALPIAAPPVVSGRGVSSAPLSKGEAQQLASQVAKPTPSRVIHAGRAQIVKSIRGQLGGLSGQDRVDKLDEILHEIATDPRQAAARKSLRFYSQGEQSLVTPQAAARNLQDRVSPIPQHKARLGVGPVAASVNLTSLGQAGTNLLGKVAPGLMSGGPEARILRNAFKDLGTVATGPFVGAYSGAKAQSSDALRLAHGDTSAILHGDTAHLLEAVAKGYADQVRHPGKAIKEHPLLSALNLAGAESVLGRTGGALARGAGQTGAPGLRGALADAGSTTRPPIALSEDLAGGVVERTYSKSLSRKRAQVASDRSREPLRDADGKVVTVQQRGREVPVLQPRTPLGRAHLNKKRADMLASRTNLTERLGREKASHTFKVKGVPRAAKDIVSMVADGTITSAAHFETDLRSHATRIRGLLAQHDAEVKAGKAPTIYRHEGEVEAARTRLKLADKVLASPQTLAKAERIVDVATEHGRRLVEGDKASAEAGLIDADQAHRARLVHTAVEHLGAKHGRDPRLDARIKRIKGVERSLQARLNFGHHAPGEAPKLRKQLETARSLRERITARNTERLRDSNGNPLEPDQIEAFLKSRGRDPDTVAYLPTNVSRKQFHAQFRPGSRGSLDKGLTRTGEQQRKGATESSAELLRAAGVRQTVALTKAQQLDKLIGEHGMIHPAVAKSAKGKPLTKAEAKVVKRGGYYTGAEATEVINRAAARGERLVAVSAYPAKLDAETSRIIREDLQGPGAMDTLGQRLLNDRVLTEDQLKSSGKARNVVLMNADLIERLQKHLVPAGNLKKFSQIANRAFRYAVLPQPRWLVGNFFEPLVIRMPGAGSGINVFGLAADIRAGTKGINALRRSSDPRLRAAADEIEGQQFGGLLIGGRGATNKRGLDDFPALDATAQKAYGKIVSKTPAVHEMADLTGRLLRGGGKAILAPLDTIFRINRAGEAVLQRAAFGTSLRRDIQEFTGSWTDTVKLGQKAVQEAAEGLVNTPTQQRYMQAQHELLGQYEGFGPTLRGVIQGVAPFLPYTLAAARFVFLTMPLHRSATTSLLIQINNVVSQDWKDQHDGLPPGTGLMIPAGGGKFVDISRYTPYGLSGQAAQGELGGITGNLLPQISGTQQALQGKNPFGDDLQLSSGDDPTLSSELKIAGNSFLEAILPYLSTARRLREHGETAYSDSNAVFPKTKEGTSHGMSAARRTFDPFRPTYFGAEEVVEPSSAPAAASGPVDRRTELLQRRAELLQRSSGGNARRDELLRRRAEILSRSR